MRNRLIAMVLCLFGMVAGGHATPNVTAEITYDLAAGRADYYFWNEEESSGNNAYMWYECSYPNSQQTCSDSGNFSTVQIYLTEQRSGIVGRLRSKDLKTLMSLTGLQGVKDTLHKRISGTQIGINATYQGIQPHIMLIRSFLRFTLSR